MVHVQGHDFPGDLFYDIENQIWYAPLPDATLRAGFTSWAVGLMGEVLVFTPKRVGRDFEKNRWFAMIECGKWIGAARAAFDGTVVAYNESLVTQPKLLNMDPFGAGWMLIARPTFDDWRSGLVTGSSVGPAIERWIADGSYKESTE